mgnify:FL=1
MAKKWRVVKRVLGALVALVVLLAAGTAGALGWFLHRTPGNVFDSNGVPIYYTDEGAGEPVILIHGVAANADLNWRKPVVVRALSRDFRVITMDLRGHGLSGKPTDPARYGMEMIGDITRLMDHLGLENAHVAGYSLGGFLVLKLVTTHPERVRSAAVCAAGWSSLVKELDDIPAPYEKPVPVREKRSAPAAPPADGASGDSARPAPKPPKPLVHRLRSAIGDFVVGDKTPIKAMKKSFPDLTVAREEIERNQVPTLCVIGDNDGLYYLGKELGEIMGAVEYVELKGPNHLTTPVDRQFKETLRGFLLRQRAG